MSKKTHNDEPPKPSRRNLLLGGAALAGLAATGILIRNNIFEDTVPKEKQTIKALHLGDVTRDINQAEINQLYQDIYERLKKAKEENKTGKPLAIIIGEDHTGTVSLITQLMILSAAKKLGINTYVTESAPEGLNLFKTQMAPALTMQHQVIETLENNINPERDLLKTPASNVIADTYIVLGAIQNNRKDGQVWIPTFALASAFLKKNNLIAMDTKQAEINSDVREQAMLKVLENLKQNYVVATGFAHAAVLKKELEAQGQSVFMIDVSNKKVALDELDEETRTRFKNFYDNADMTVVINGRPPGTINELYAHAAMAELTFDYAKNPGFLATLKDSLSNTLQLPASRQR